MAAYWVPLFGDCSGWGEHLPLLSTYQRNWIHILKFLNWQVILPGENIEFIRNDSSGPLIISVKGSRLVIGRGMAQKIHVK